MLRTNFTSLALTLSLVLSASGAMASGQSSWKDNWKDGWKDKWNSGHNGGHNGGHDGGHGGGHGGGHDDNNGHKWYSDYHHRWFDKSGHCSQYNGYGKDTCNSGKDYMQCDYDHHSGSCYPERGHH